MKTKVILVLLFLVQLFSVYGQTHYELNGAIVPRTIDFQNQKLQLNGFGSRSKMWIEIYVQALYVLKFSQDPKELIESDITMAIRIQNTSSLVTSRKLGKSLQKGLLKSVGEEGFKKIEAQSKQFEDIIALEENKLGDAYNFVYNPEDQSLWVIRNDKVMGKIPGMEFKKAFFGIWLSDNPVDDDLKKSLLGY